MKFKDYISQSDRATKNDLTFYTIFGVIGVLLVLLGVILGGPHACILCACGIGEILVAVSTFGKVYQKFLADTRVRVRVKDLGREV